MKNCFVIIIISSFIAACANKEEKQNFEGVLESKVTYISKIDSLSATELFGQSSAKDVTYVKDGFFKVTSTTDFMSLMLWRHMDTTLYSFNKSSGDTLWFDRTNSHPRSIVEHQIIRNADTILNYVCDALVIINDKDKVLTYYYSPELSLNPEFYLNATNSANYEVMKLIKSVTLRIKIESSYGIVDSEAVKITHTKLDDKLFDIPTHSVLRESVY
jgi:ABC-type tungstate transport system permease subunit